MMGRAFAHGYGYGGYGCGGFGWWLPMLIGILVIGLIVYLIVRKPRRHKENHGSQAMVILNERLAKGEITAEEYENLKKIIHH